MLGKTTFKFCGNVDPFQRDCYIFGVEFDTFVNLLSWTSFVTFKKTIQGDRLLAIEYFCDVFNVGMAFCKAIKSKSIL